MAHGVSASSRVLGRALVLTLGFAGVEAVAGFFAGSLALVSDAGHMATDSASLGVALVAAWVASRRPSARYTYGLGRAEVVAAIVNGLFMCGIVTWVVVEAIGRLGSPHAVRGTILLVVAAAGLLLNVLVARTLMHGAQTLNTRAALLHVFADLLGSVVAVVAGVVIVLSGWTTIDPLLSLVICVLILASAWRILKEGIHILLEGAPLHLSTNDVGQAMASVDGVRSVHDLHLWQVGSDRVALSAHVVLADTHRWEETIERVRARVHERFGIDHATLQPERAPRPVQIDLGPTNGDARPG